MKTRRVRAILLALGVLLVAIQVVQLRRLGGRG